MTRPPRRALVVEDERLPRTEFVAMIRDDGRLQVVGEEGSLAGAIDAVERLAPDVVFLDIQLGGESGFALLEHCQDQEIVFVTAHDEHAVQAFEVNAMDYLLKPVAPDRLRAAIDRLVAEREELVSASESSLLTIRDRLFLRLDDRWGFLRIGDIVLIQAEGSSSRVRTIDGNEHLAGKSLQEWQLRLPPRQFPRVHRSTIVNVDHVSRVEDWSHYSYQVHIRSLEEPVIMSRRYAARLKRLLG